jgi:beta-glucosidase
MYDSKSKTWRVAGGGYKVLLAHDAGDTKAASVTVQLPKQTLNVAGKPTK